ncbi:hypothetical protein RIF29_03318 [Crotalaria pallida]|uniref:Uncharacterized protein n=1 Tax=Crotalaria pallida TaxID=3830 RepID=A0AAN9J0P0_CROPI
MTISLNVFLEPQRGHGPQQVVAVDGLTLLTLALVGGFAGYEADELRHALLHLLLRVLRDLRIFWQRLLHYPAPVRYRQEPVLLLQRHLPALSSTTVLFSAGGIRH